MLQVPIYVSRCPWPPQEAEAEDPEIDVEAGPATSTITFLLRRLGAQGDYKLLVY